MLQNQLRREAVRGFLSGLVVGSLGGGLCVWSLSGEPAKCSEAPKRPPDSPAQPQGGEPGQPRPPDGAAGDGAAARASRLLLHGEPQPARPVARFTNHVVGYDAARKVPVWVLEHIDRSKVKGEANRRRSRFGPDPDTSAPFSASHADYKGSGWSRGHMAPAGNNKHDQRAMDETFYYTNIVPQDFDNNSGFWNRLEIYCRQLTESYDDVHVVSGPLFLPEAQEDGRRFVRYQVIGEGEVAVPTHLYKVVAASRGGESPRVGVFVVPNAPVASHRQLADFKWPLHEVERRAGVTFFDQLDWAAALDLCQADGCRLPAHDEVERPYIERRLSAAGSQQQLDRAWTDFKRRRVSYTARSVELYQRKQAELSAGGREL